MARKDAIKKMKDVLITRRRALRMALDGDMSLLRQIQQESSGDAADFALDATNDEISSQLAEVESRELAQIEIALQKFEEGTYGKCEACNCNIPLARIQALPYATLCIGCQRQMEESGGSLPLPGDWSKIAENNSVDDLRMGDMDPNFS